MLPVLPLEITITIFVFAAYSNRSSALTLSQVAKWVHKYVSMDTWSVLILAEDLHGEYVPQTGDDERTLRSSIPADLERMRRDNLLPHIHSLAILPSELTINRLQTEFSEDEPAIAALRALRTAMSSTLCPRVRRLYLPVVVFADVVGSNSDYPALTELDLNAIIPGLIPVSEYISATVRYIAVRQNHFPSLTHLRLPDGGLLEYDPEEEFEFYSAIVSGLPSLTHLAYEYSRERVAKGFTEGRNIVDLPPARLLDEYRSLQCLVLLLRDEGRDAGEGRPVQQMVDQHDERLLILWVDVDGQNYWKLWGRLAREDRNIWNQALVERQRRRDTID